MSRNVYFVYMMLSLLMLHTQPVIPQSDLYSLIAIKLLSLFQSGNFSFLGHQCQYSVKPRISKFQLKYDAKVWCPGFAPLTGRATKVSRSGATEWAIKDYARQAVESNLATQDEVRIWLKN